MARQPTLLSFISPVQNRGAFSSHWLEHRLNLEPDWDERAEDAIDALRIVLKLWEKEHKRVEKYANEQALEVGFIQPVMKALGWRFKYQTFLQVRKPDYALFLSDADLDTALGTDHTTDDFWTPAAAVADAKEYDLPLDKKIATSGKREYPPEQIEWYLDRSRKPFGILTNGRLWRLVPRELGSHQRRFQTYYEADLVSILKDASGTGEPSIEAIEDFRRFFLFFGPAGFLERDGRKQLIQRAVEGSSEYRVGVSGGLKAKAFEALRICIEGFLGFGPNKLDGARDLDVCRANSFILLCRLLFIMFAEDRQLLPYRVHRTYTNNRSLGKLRDEIATKLDLAKLGHDKYSKEKTDLWASLNELCDLIDQGRAAYSVPAYNGGLFKPEAHPFLTEKKLSDWHLAQVIDNLGRAPDPDHPSEGLFRVDYRDLAIQHLGGIYEGLLENHPKLAAVRVVVFNRREKGLIEERYVAETEQKPQGFHPTSTEYAAGSVYLVKNKNERRTFGSYYTPDNIVDHIIRQTIAPLCTGITADIAKEIEAAEKRGADEAELDRLDTDFPNRVLKLRILDPSMGSGHFLLSACQYLAEQIAVNQYTPPGPDTGTADDALAFWKRRVIENCLYGVDVNPLAVDLAKLALWLETVARDRPLTFLDHHLKHGNSLIGARLRSLAAPFDATEHFVDALAPAFRKKLPTVLSPLAAIRELPSDTLKAIEQKNDLFDAYLKSVEQFWQLADLWAADAAGGSVQPTDYREAAETVDKPRKFKELMERPQFADALRFGGGKLNAFHWDLAFPEVFCDDNGPLEAGGFDAVIGNPPYEVLSEKESEMDPTDLKTFVSHEHLYDPAVRGKQNLYKLFICRGLDVLRDGGRFGFIVPMPLLGDDQAASVRRHMVDVGGFAAIDAFPHKDNPRKRVFEDAKLSTTVFNYVKGRHAAAMPFLSTVHPERTIEKQSPSLLLSTSDIPEYDPDNFTIVSCGQEDWDLAVRIIKTHRMNRLGRYCTSFQGEVNETTDWDNCLSSDTRNGPTVLRGSNISLYQVREASQGEVVFVNSAKFFHGKQPGSKAHFARQQRVGFQRSAPQNNFRRVIAACIASNSFCFDTVSFIPESRSQLPLSFVMGLLNSLLIDWYFRLGSTNSKVNEYQFNNFPCPDFQSDVSHDETATGEDVLMHLEADQPDQALALLRPLLETAPFSPVLRDAIILAVERIVAIERERGEISRTDRSALAPEAQPFQDFIDALFFGMAGFSDAEVVGLRTRYEQMKKVK